MISTKIASLFIAIGLCVASIASASAAKYQLCRVMPVNEDELKMLTRLHDSNVAGCTFLNKVQQKNVPVLIIVAPFGLGQFNETIKVANTKCRSMAGDIRTNDFAVRVANSNRRSEKYSWTEYHELDDTYKWLRSLARRAPKFVSVITAGRSYEDRKILGVKIAFNGDSKEAILLQGGAHGNEWISPAVLNYIIHQILTRKDFRVRSLFESYTWYIIPHTNPDGYVYTHISDRFWRKTRSRQNGTSCFGVDLGRNWGFHWNESDGTNDRCSNIYPGPRKFSEIESQSLSEYIGKIKEKLVFHLTIDGTNQWIFSPLGYANESVRNADNLKRTVDFAISSIRRKSNNTYTGGQMSTELYPVSGTSMDWSYGELKIDYSFILQLPPRTEMNQFLETAYLVPSNKIVPIGEDAVCALVQMLRFYSILESDKE